MTKEKFPWKTIRECDVAHNAYKLMLCKRYSIVSKCFWFERAICVLGTMSPTHFYNDVEIVAGKINNIQMRQKIRYFKHCKNTSSSVLAKRCWTNHRENRIEREIFFSTYKSKLPLGHSPPLKRDIRFMCYMHILLYGQHHSALSAHTFRTFEQNSSAVQKCLLCVQCALATAMATAPRRQGMV